MGYLPGWRVAGQPVCLSAEEPPGPDELIEMGYGFPHGKPALVGRKVPPGEPAGRPSDATGEVVGGAARLGGSRLRDFLGQLRDNEETNVADLLFG